jgi:uncharacterized protein (DUF2164 family)
MNKKYDKEELLQQIHELRLNFDKNTDILAHQKPFLNNELQKIIIDNGFEIIGINVGLKNIINKIDNEVHDMHREISKMERRIQFYYDHLIYDKNEYNIEFFDDLTHCEDDMFHVIPDYLFREHSFKLNKFDFHKRIDGMEFDCIARGTTYLGRDKRNVSIEFKENDFTKVVDQSLKRKHYMHAQYVVTNSPPDYIYEKCRGDLDELSKNNIGLVSVIVRYRGKEKELIPIKLLSASVNTKVKNPDIESFIGGSCAKN